MQFYIISKELYDQVTADKGQDWPCCESQTVSPRLIDLGPDAGSYAVNTAFLDGDLCKEQYRAILEACIVKELVMVLSDKGYVLFQS